MEAINPKKVIKVVLLNGMSFDTLTVEKDPSGVGIYIYTMLNGEMRGLSIPRNSLAYVSYPVKADEMRRAS